MRKAGRLRSAGGVVIKGSGDDLRIAVMRSGYDTWVFPKGGIESGETPQGAAAREIGEEIGVRPVALLSALGDTEHEYTREKTLHRKQVEWFLFRAGSEAELSPNAHEDALDCGWFAPKQALSLLSHPDQRRILRRALSALKPDTSSL